MGENSLRVSSMISAKDQGIRGSYPLLIIHIRIGMAERKNRTIMEAMKALLHDQDLSSHLWAKAARTSGICTEQNGSSGIRKQDSERNDLIVQYIFMLPKKRTKLNPSGKKGLFVGYSETSKAYRIQEDIGSQ